MNNLRKALVKGLLSVWDTWLKKTRFVIQHKIRHWYDFIYNE